GSEADYRALWATGPKASHVVAFQRGEGVIAAAPRLVLNLEGWSETSLEIPEGPWENQFTGEIVEGGKIEMAALFRRFPVALLVNRSLVKPVS
ncbi:MAG TPA: hypothetical protein VFW83_05455, partial [Bryobacteraceae bacterium]|nr:hypothetical protein [Bryobacteraceae bacterium]